MMEQQELNSSNQLRMQHSKRRVHQRNNCIFNIKIMKNEMLNYNCSMKKKKKRKKQEVKTVRPQKDTQQIQFLQIQLLFTQRSSLKNLMSEEISFILRDIKYMKEMKIYVISALFPPTNIQVRLYRLITAAHKIFLIALP